MQALIVEDDRHLASALEHILAREGYGCDVVHDGEAGLAFAETGRYDVIIFDIMLPKVDGLRAVQRLRKGGLDTPILMLTARDTTPDKIIGLDSGADAYMTKPFSPSELLARLRALTRRKTKAPQDAVRAADLVLDRETHDLACASEAITLSHKELLLADLLLSNFGRVVTKRAIAEAVWDQGAEVDDNNVEAYVSMLRKKLAFLGSAAEIRLERKTGYALEWSHRPDAQPLASADCAGASANADAGAPDADAGASPSKSPGRPC